MTTAEVETPAPPLPTSPAERRSKRWPWIAAIAALVVVSGVLAVMLVQANQQLSDTQALLSDSEADLAAIESDLEQVSSRLDAEEQQVTEQASEISELEGRIFTGWRALTDMTEQFQAADAARSQYTDFLAATVAVGFGFAEADAQCVAAGLVADGSITEGMTAYLAGTATESEALATGLAVFRSADDCGVEVPITPQAGYAYGDNATLDGYQDMCTAGSGHACDSLYWESPVGSAYERFGATCGDRFTIDESQPGNCAAAIGF